MIPTPPRSPAKALFRVASLVVPAAVAWCEAFADPHPSDLTETVTYALGPLWVLLAAALLLRTIAAIARRHRDPSTSILAQLDILTSAGSALAWFSAASILGATWLGWASLAAVGLLGTSIFHLMVLLALLATRGADPMRVASIARRFSPELVTEGDEVVEELRFEGVRIPTGFRLFVEGRVGPRWATSRHVLESSDSGSEVVLESEVGPAIRGEHEPEPLAVWLEDSFGICRSLRGEVSAPLLTVLPRVRATDKAAAQLGRGDGPHAPRATSRLPTEGFFRLREYQLGDDVRRIHWVRSVAARELIVRLPDEVPPDRPHVRLVLDTFFPEAFLLSCDAPSEMLDAMVGVWLAVGRTLAESGTQVTLVTSLRQGERFAKRRQDFSMRALGPALRLGAQVEWQDRMNVDHLLTDETTLVVSRAMLARPMQGNVRWIAVMPSDATTELAWPTTSAPRLPYPMGSADNRWTRTREASTRFARRWGDHARALALMHRIPGPLTGSFLARVDGARIRLDAFS